MSRLARVMTLVLALSSVAVASAEAVTWHNTGDTAFTATSGTLFFSTTGTATTDMCLSTPSAATVSATPATGAVWSAITITTRYHCFLLGSVAYNWHCTRTFTATAQSGGVTTGSTDTTCELIEGGVVNCHATGTQTGSYINPVGSTTGRLTVGHADLDATPSPGPQGNCFYLGNPRLTMNPQTYTITTGTGGPAPHLGPVITRTP